MLKATSILIIAPAWIGDMVMSQALYKTLKQQNSNAVIDVVAPEWSLPVLQRMPEIRSAIALSVKHGELGFMKRWKLARTLKKNHYSQAIILPRSLKSALVPFFARIPKRTGYLGESRYGLINDRHELDKKSLPTVVQRYVNLATHGAESLELDCLPKPELSVVSEQVKKRLSDLSLSIDKPVIAFMPGASYGPAKQWPVDYYSLLAKKLVQLGYRVWVFGSIAEQAIGDAIAQSSTDSPSNDLNDGVINLCGKTSLIDTVDLLSVVKKAVTNDSGLMHVAAAVGCDLVAIYGSSSPQYTPPLTHHKNIVYKGLACSPCFKRDCPLGHTNCLNDISVDHVLALMT